MPHNYTYERKSVWPHLPPTLLEPIGFRKFKGDTWPEALKNLSVNDLFNIGETYPVYHYEGMDFVVGSNGKEYKITPAAWTNLQKKAPTNS